MRVYFVVNPTAGRGRANAVWKRIVALLQSHRENDVEWEAALTDGPGAATRLAARAAERGYDRIVGVGGDGTLSEVLNGMAGSTAEIAAVPAGTGNDYCRSAGIPLDPMAAARLALSGTAVPVDIGEMIPRSGRPRFFLNVAGIGFDAEVARAVNRMPKRFGSTVPYVLGALRTLAWYRPVPMALHVDGRTLERRVLLAAVGLGRYYAGGMMITPDAVLDDGVFDLCVAGDIGPMGVVRLLPGIYRGRHRSDPRVEFFRCREIALESTRPLAIHAEGEVVGELPARFRIHPSRLLLVREEGVAPGAGSARVPAAR